MYNNELYHYGVKGMKWGVRRARRENAKIDKSFKKWRDGAANKQKAIDLGMDRNLKKIAYESNKNDKALKTAYKQSNKAYKKALKKNTTYRKGSVREAVGKDLSRKYLSESKKIKKQLNADPGNRELKKQYRHLSDGHAIERAKARRAQAVAARRSRLRASFKRSLTMGVSAVATGAAISLGASAMNGYFDKHNTRLDGKKLHVTSGNIRSAIRTVDKVKKFMGYMY